MSILFSAAVAFATARRYVAVTRRAASTFGASELADGPIAEVALATNDPSQVLLRTRKAVALRLNPITEHHHVVWWDPDSETESEAVDRLPELKLSDRLELFRTVRATQMQLTEATGAGDFNVSWQEGAGQPVPGGLRRWARYVHVVPRFENDLEGDAVHEMLAQWTFRQGVPSNPEEPWPEDDERHNRTRAIMAAEAASFRAIMDGHWGGHGDDEHEQTGFTFGRIKIPGSQVFYESGSGRTVAFVNLRPLRPGHVLVSPRRKVSHLSNLTQPEFDDLIQSAWEISEAFQGAHADAAEASDDKKGAEHRGFIFAVQDGVLANQSIPHVHIHLIPR